MPKMLQYAPFSVVHPPPKQPTQKIEKVEPVAPKIRRDVAADTVYWKPHRITFTVSPMVLLYFVLFLSIFNFFLLCKLLTSSNY
mgnify:CR=1|tara:strand:- start:329 stop:580 length:252 start_codon:yes stop_codon:yes gene_type:complete